MSFNKSQTPYEADYIIVGGGLTGCALASRLSKSASVLLVEAGPDPTPELHDVKTPSGGFLLAGTDLDWQYRTQASQSTSGRQFTLTAGKTLGGGSIVNYGGWSRGDAADYDAWSTYIPKHDSTVQWTYEDLLPYFRRSESFYDTATAAPEQHGYDGPMRVTAVAGTMPIEAQFPLREPIRRAWAELNVKPVRASCAGSNAGIDNYLENWIDGKRQPVQDSYPLDTVKVLTGTPVAKILFHDASIPRAKGILLADGRQFLATKEVIVCAGTLQSPTILQASGIGPADLLIKHSVPLVHHLPSVGASYFDHFAMFQLWKLKPSERGLALGAVDLTDPELMRGLPADWLVNERPPTDVLEAALDKDGITDPSVRSALLAPERCFVETAVFYHPMAPGIPLDGSWIATSVMLTLPSSRGHIYLGEGGSGGSSALIEPNYFSTALDRVCLVYGVRRLLSLLLGSEAMKPYVEAEVPPPGIEPALTPSSTDAEIEARIRAGGVAHAHPMGSVPLGAALQSSLKVKGVDGLRVCDASIFPSSVGGHPQATLYAIAERAAEIIPTTS